MRKPVWITLLILLALVVGVLIFWTPIIGILGGGVPVNLDPVSATMDASSRTVTYTAKYSKSETWPNKIGYEVKSGNASADDAIAELKTTVTRDNSDTLTFTLEIDPEFTVAKHAEGIEVKVTVYGGWFNWFSKSATLTVNPVP